MLSNLKIYLWWRCISSGQASGELLLQVGCLMSGERCERGLIKPAVKHIQVVGLSTERSLAENLFLRLQKELLWSPSSECFCPGSVSRLFLLMKLLYVQGGLVHTHTHTHAHKKWCDVIQVIRAQAQKPVMGNKSNFPHVLWLSTDLRVLFTSEFLFLLLYSSTP